MSDTKIAYWIVRVAQITTIAAIFNQYGVLATTMTLAALVLTAVRVMLSKEMKNESMQVRHIP